jgi:hypothetical protein
VGRAIVLLALYPESIMKDLKRVRRIDHWIGGVVHMLPTIYVENQNALTAPIHRSSHYMIMNFIFDLELMYNSCFGHGTL